MAANTFIGYGRRMPEQHGERGGAFGRRLLGSTILLSLAALVLGAVFAQRAYDDAVRDETEAIRVEAGHSAQVAKLFLDDRVQLVRAVASAPAVVAGDRPAMRELLRAMLGERSTTSAGWRLTGDARYCRA